MKNTKYFYSFFFSIIIFLLIIPLINFYMDPFNYYNSNKDSFERRISKNLVNYQSVSIHSDWQDHLLKYFLLLNSDYNQNILIGSSRSYAINSKIIGEKIMNYSLSAAGVEEIISFTNLSTTKKKVDKIIISIDPWIFDEKYNKLSPIFYNFYKNGLNEISQKPDKKDFLKNIKRKISYLYKPYILFRSFIEIFYKVLSKEVYLTYDKFEDNINYENTHIIKPDGSLIYPKKIFLIKHDKIQEEVFKEMQNYKDLRFNFSRKKTNILLDYINQLAKTKKVEILFIPYNPLSFRVINSRSRNFFLSEEIIKKNLDSKKNIKLIGSFNPNKTKCLQKDFLDSHHPRLACISKLYKFN